MAAVYLVLLGSFICSLKGQAGLYAIAGPNYARGASSLVSYDVNTGAATTIVPAGEINAKLTAQNLGCFDSVNSIYYFVSNIANGSDKTGQTTVLYGYDLKDPSNKIDEIALNQIKAQGMTGSGDACIGDGAGNILIFGHDNYNNTNQLLLNMSRNSNGKVEFKTIGNYYKVDDSPLLAGDPVILDTKRNMLWVSGVQGGQDMYFYIDLQDGRLKQTVNFHQFPLITGAIYDSSLDSVIGVKFVGDNSNMEFEFALDYADPVNVSDITKQCAVGMVGYCGQTKAVTIDHDHDILYSLMIKNNDCNNNYTNDVYLVGTDIKSGKELTSVIIAELDGTLNTSPEDILYWNGK